MATVLLESTRILYLSSGVSLLNLWMQTLRWFTKLLRPSTLDIALRISPWKYLTFSRTCLHKMPCLKCLSVTLCNLLNSLENTKLLLNQLPMCLSTLRARILFTKMQNSVVKMHKSFLKKF